MAKQSVFDKIRQRNLAPDPRPAITTGGGGGVPGGIGSRMNAQPRVRETSIGETPDDTRSSLDRRLFNGGMDGSQPARSIIDVRGAQPAVAQPTVVATPSAPAPNVAPPVQAAASTPLKKVTYPDGTIHEYHVPTAASPDSASAPSLGGRMAGTAPAPVPISAGNAPPGPGMNYVTELADLKQRMARGETNPATGRPYGLQDLSDLAAKYPQGAGAPATTIAATSQGGGEDVTAPIPGQGIGAFMNPNAPKPSPASGAAATPTPGVVNEPGAPPATTGGGAPPATTPPAGTPPATPPGQPPTSIDYYKQLQAGNPNQAPGTLPPGITPDQMAPWQAQIKTAGDAMRAAAQSQADLTLSRSGEQLNSWLAAHGISNSGASVREYGRLLENANNNMAQVESTIAQNQAAMFNNLLGKFTDTAMAQQLAGTQSYYSRLSFADQANLQLSLQAGDQQAVMQRLKMEQSFTADQGQLNRDFEMGKLSKTEDFDHLMQNEQFAQRTREQLAGFNQQNHTQLSEHDFLAGQNDANRALQSGLQLSDQQFQFKMTDKNYANALTLQTNTFNQQNHTQLTEHDFLNTQQKAQFDFSNGQLTSTQNFQAMMQKESFKNQSALLAQQIFGQKDLQKGQQNFQLLMTEGSAAVFGQELQEKIANGTATDAEKAEMGRLHDYQAMSANPPEPKDANYAQWQALNGEFGGGVEGAWKHEGRVAQLEFQRQLSAALFQVGLSTEAGANWMDNLIRHTGMGSLISGGGAANAISDTSSPAVARSNIGYGEWLDQGHGGARADSQAMRDAYNAWRAGGGP